MIKMEDILKPGYSLADLGGKIEDTLEFRKELAASRERQKKVLKQKILRSETLNLRITI